MPQPLAFLNDEEMHGLNDLGLPNQRRWLNHRNSVTNTAERFPPPPRILTDLATKKHKRHKNSFPLNCIFFCDFCAFLWLLFRLTETEFAGAALFAFEAAANLQQAIEHLRTLGAARGELRVGLFVHVLEPV